MLTFRFMNSRLAISPSLSGWKNSCSCSFCRQAFTFLKAAAVELLWRCGDGSEEIPQQACAKPFVLELQASGFVRCCCSEAFLHIALRELELVKHCSARPGFEFLVDLLLRNKCSQCERLLKQHVA